MENSRDNTSAPAAASEPTKILFYSHRHDRENWCWSNFSNHPIYYEKQIWRFTEAPFQYEKYRYTDPEHAEKILRAKTPHEAAELGRDRTHKMREDWDKPYTGEIPPQVAELWQKIVGEAMRVKDWFMLNVVFCKIHQHSDLYELLCATNDAILIEHTKNDRYWADGGDGCGKNILGKILMIKRALPGFKLPETKSYSAVAKVTEPLAAQEVTATSATAAASATPDVIKTRTKIFFHSHDQNEAYWQFAAFADYPLFWAGVWRNSMAAFHAAKLMFINNERTKFAEEIRRANENQQIIDLARKYESHTHYNWEEEVRSVKVAPGIAAAWKEVIGGEVILTKEFRLFSIEQLKFDQHSELRECLLETGDAELIEHCEDSYWGDGNDGSGKNMRGKILMLIRHLLQEHDRMKTQ